MPTSSHTAKAKITVTLSSEVVQQLDALVDTPGKQSRSQLVEEAVRHWLDERLQHKIDKETEAYYQSLSAAELEEDQEWSALATGNCSKTPGQEGGGVAVRMRSGRGGRSFCRARRSRR